MQQRFTLQPTCHKAPPSPGVNKKQCNEDVKLVLDAINDDNTDQDVGKIEMPTAEETEDESVTQEVQSSKSM